ncbi:MAG TPA: adenylosuccinate synthase [Candidatus Marinimicrobia bacterium]|nr:adenylosuccinate synthase [Candidatus Neomarinimicrobiota bacterium]
MLPGEHFIFWRIIMPVTAVLGAQWGDEGKGKIVDNFSEKANVVARFQGGANAGHTIVVKGQETILHQLPSGILHAGTDCILGNGMVLDPIGLVNEMNSLKNEGLSLEGRIHISLLAHIVTPLHKVLDAKSEASLGSKAIGTTKRGIGPCYSDKINRTGIQVRDCQNPESLQKTIDSKIKEAVQKGLLSSAEKSDLEKELKKFYSCVAEVYSYAADTSMLMNRYIRSDKNILVEGAQGTLLDVDFGSYPFVTSSNTISGNICTGLGIGPKSVDYIIGVYKSYTTRVGAGPFPTEQNNEYGEYLQRAGSELGATTHRKRRCGWFDAAIGRYSAMINGFTSIAITKLDVLDKLDKIMVCTHYENGNFPEIDLASAVPHYISIKGWQQSTSTARIFSDLPTEAQEYLKIIEDLLEIPISYVSVGKEREQFIRL